MLSVFNNQQTLEAATFLSLCVSSPASFFFLSCFFNVTLFRILPVLFLTYFTLLLSSPFQRLNSCDRPSFEQGNAQGQQLSEGHWSRLCSSVRGIAENYTAIKTVTVFLCRNIYIYIYIWYTERGDVLWLLRYYMREEVQQGPRLRALPGNELWVQESPQRAAVRKQ